MIRLKKSTLCFALCAMALTAFSQSRVMVTAEPGLRNLNAPLRSAMLFTYKFNGRAVSYSGKVYEVSAPDLLSDAPLFAVISFGGMRSALPDSGATLVLIDPRGAEGTYIYADQNQNLNLKDDGPPVVLANGQAVVLTLRNRRNAKATGILELSFAIYKDAEHKKRIVSFADHEHPIYAGNQFAEPEMWMMFTEKNYRLFRLGSHGLELGLKDTNYNGFFNDEGIDEILVGDSVQPVINDRAKMMKSTISRNHVVLLGKQRYTLDHVSALGDTLVLMATSQSLEARALLRAGSEMPDFQFVLFSGKSTRWSAVKSKTQYTLVDLWGTWCKPCLAQTPDLLALHADYKKKLQIVGLAYQANHGAAVKYVKEKNMSWPQGFVDAAFVKNYSISSFPHYILLDAQNRIVKSDLKLAEVREFMNGE